MAIVIGARLRVKNDGDPGQCLSEHSAALSLTKKETMGLPITHASAAPKAFTATGQHHHQTTSTGEGGGEQSRKAQIYQPRLIFIGWMSSNRYRKELYDRPTASFELMSRNHKSPAPHTTGRCFGSVDPRVGHGTTSPSNGLAARTS